MEGRKGIGPEIKVGLFVLVGLVLLAYMSIKITKYGIRMKRGYEISAIFDSVSGLVKDAPVEMAGVEVGRVKDISLKDGQARVDIIMDPSVHLKKDSQALIRTKGVLGDKFVEILPGTLAEEIDPGGIIINTTSPVELDQLLTDVGPILHTLGDVFGIKEGKETFDHYPLYARFSSVAGLKVGASIEMAGVWIGQVDSIFLDPEEQVAVVKMKIQKGIVLTDDVIASVKTSGLIGGKYIEISPGGSDNILKTGDSVIETESAIDLEELVSKYVFSSVKGED